MKVNIVVPAWNEEKRILKCLDSIKKQDFQDFKVIIVNDGSTDNTQSVIDDFTSKDSRFTSIIKGHSGIGDTLNAGFALCTAELLTWISADSWVNPNFINELKSALDQNPDKILAYSDWTLFNEINNSYTSIITKEYNRKDLQVKCEIGPCWMFRKTAKDQAGPYCLEICEDYYMHLLLSGLGDFIRVPKDLGYWRNHKDNTTNRLNIPTYGACTSVVKAKARWEQTKYKVAYICPTFDAATVGWLHTNIINDLSENFSARHILGGNASYLTMGTDLLLGSPESIQVIKECDVVHINNTFPDFSPELFLLLRNKPIVVHLHATHQQWNLKKIYWWKNQGIDIYTCVPGHEHATWVPNAVPLTNGLDISYEHLYTPIKRANSKLKFICHHNYLEGKGILQLKNQIIPALNKEFFNGTLNNFMEWSITESNIPLIEHLKYKQSIDICYDTITHGYCGMATWESMCQAATVICRMDELTQKTYKDFFGSVPPIINVRLVDDVANHLYNIITNQNLVKELGEKNRKWMLENYSSDKILNCYEKIYMKAINGRIQQRQSLVPYGKNFYSQGWTSTKSSTCSSNHIRLL